MPNVGDVQVDFGKRKGAIVAGAFFKVNVLAGAAAGNHTLTGVIVGDAIVSVLQAVGAGLDVTDRKSVV